MLYTTGDAPRTPIVSWLHHQSLRYSQFFVEAAQNTQKTSEDWAHEVLPYLAEFRSPRASGRTVCTLSKVLPFRDIGNVQNRSIPADQAVSIWLSAKAIWSGGLL